MRWALLRKVCSAREERSRGAVQRYSASTSIEDATWYTSVK